MSANGGGGLAIGAKAGYGNGRFGVGSHGGGSNSFVPIRVLDQCSVSVEAASPIKCDGCVDGQVGKAGMSGGGIVSPLSGLDIGQGSPRAVTRKSGETSRSFSCWEKYSRQPAP